VFKRVLVPIAEDSDVEFVIRWSESVAEPFKTELLLLRVIDPKDLRDGEAETFLKRAASRVTYGRFNVRTIVTKGSIAEEIVRVAIEHDADLITMATKTRLGVKGSMVNSVTRRVLHANKVPVLVLNSDGLKKSEYHSPKFVIVPLDGSNNSESVVEFATDFAGECGAKLVFVRVTNPTFPGLSTLAGKPMQGSKSSLYIRDFAKEYLNRFVESARENGISASLRTPSGSTSACIAALAAENINTLVVIGTQGIGGLKRTVVGSVADKVVRSTSQPVLVIPVSSALVVGAGHK